VGSGLRQQSGSFIDERDQNAILLVTRCAVRTGNTK
jgi:hypothetical protein